MTTVSILYWTKRMSPDALFSFTKKHRGRAEAAVRIALQNQEYKLLPITLDITTPDDAFVILNRGDSPLGSPENQAWLRTNGVGHTGMVPGDLVFILGQLYVCLVEGWGTIYCGADFVERYGSLEFVL